VTSGISGTRTLIASAVLATGDFRALSRVIEVPNLPTDPENINRDDPDALVDVDTFRASGTLSF
jgi:hypothetical protein